MWMTKAVALATLSVQHSMVGLLVRQARTTGTGKFLPQTGVIMQEVVKLCASLVFALLAGENLAAIASSPMELARSCVPALLYLVQNNLQYVALAHLDPATYVVTYQLKILSTALMSVLLLRRSLSLQKWAALALLTAGVSVVQLASAELGAAPGDGGKHVGSQLLGLAAVLTSCAISGLAGVYTEMILKASAVTLWVRNVQLAAFSLALGAVGLLTTGEMAQVRADGFFQGFNAWTVASVFNNSFGGLLIAVVIKYADNIIKNFATAISIVLTTAVSTYALGLSFSSTFLGGVFIVCCATFLYGGAFDDLLRLFRSGKTSKTSK